ESDLKNELAAMREARVSRVMTQPQQMRQPNPHDDVRKLSTRTRAAPPPPIITTGLDKKPRKQLMHFPLQMKSGPMIGNRPRSKSNTDLPRIPHLTMSLGVS